MSRRSKIHRRCSIIKSNKKKRINSYEITKNSLCRNIVIYYNDYVKYRQSLGDNSLSLKNGSVIYKIAKVTDKEYKAIKGVSLGNSCIDSFKSKLKTIYSHELLLAK